MNGRYLHEAMGGIGADLVLESGFHVYKNQTARKLAGLAACLVLLAGITTAMLLFTSDAGYVPALSQPVGSADGSGKGSLPVLWWLSLLPALAAWSLPIWSICKKEYAPWKIVASAACCAAVLLMQIVAFDTWLWFGSDNIIKNYVNLMSVSSVAVPVITVLLWGAFHVVVRGTWNRELFANGLFFLLCLLSAIQYAFLVGVHKGYVVVGGLVELAAVTAAGILYLVRLFSGRGERALNWINMILLVMQIIPFALSIAFSWNFCTVYHALCMLLGIQLWRFRWKRNRAGRIGDL